MYTAFPSLAENLTPIAAAYGLQPLTLPPDINIVVLSSSELVEGVATSMLSMLDVDPNTFIRMYTDFEWNMSRTVGVSIMTMSADSDPSHIYIIPVRNFTLAIWWQWVFIFFPDRFTSYKSSPPACCAFLPLVGSSRLVRLSRVILHV